MNKSQQHLVSQAANKTQRCLTVLIISVFKVDFFFLLLCLLFSILLFLCETLAPFFFFES